MVTIRTIRGPLSNRTARKAARPITTDAPSGVRHWITITAVTRALTGDPGREADTRVAKATAEAAGAKGVWLSAELGVNPEVWS